MPLSAVDSGTSKSGILLPGISSSGGKSTHSVHRGAAPDPAETAVPEHGMAGAGFDQLENISQEDAQLVPMP